MTPSNQDSFGDELRDESTPRADPGARASTPRRVTYGLEGAEEERAAKVAEAKPKATGRRMGQRLRRAVGLVVVGALLLNVPAMYLSVRTKAWRFAVDEVPAARVALVIADGTTSSEVRAELVAAADDLRENHLIRDLVLVGPGFAGTTETATGPARTLADPATLYDSCEHASTALDLTGGVVIVPMPDLDRTLYACRQRGVAVMGVGVGPTPSIGLRRSADAIRTLWRVHISRPGPRYLGPERPIN